MVIIVRKAIQKTVINNRYAPFFMCLIRHLLPINFELNLSIYLQVANTTDKDTSPDKPVHTADTSANKERHNTVEVANNNFHDDQKTCSPNPVVHPSDKKAF